MQSQEDLDLIFENIFFLSRSSSMGLSPDYPSVSALQKYVRLIKKRSGGVCLKELRK